MTNRKSMQSVYSVLGFTFLASVPFTHGKVLDCQALFDQDSKALAKISLSARSAMIENLAKSLEPGDTFLLPRNVEMGDVDLSSIPNHIDIAYGKSGTLYLGGVHSGMNIRNVHGNLILNASKPSNMGGLAKKTANSGLFNSTIANTKGDIVSGQMEGNTMINNDGKLIIKETMKNTKIFYHRYHNPCLTPCIDFDLKGTGQGSLVYHLVEHNYGESNNSVSIKNAQDLVFLAGDTEGSEAAAGCWRMENCKNVVIAAHRDFHSHTTGRKGTGGLSYAFLGGSNNKIYYTQSIGDPFPNSLDVKEPGFEIWGAFMEDKVLLPDDALQIFHTPEGMILKELSWTEPANVDKEVVFNYKGTDITKSTGKTVTLPVPPDIRVGGNAVSGLAKQSNSYEVTKTWGAALLAAGADPTGGRASDAAFEKVLTELSFVEIPEGKFRFEKDLELGRSSISANSLVGAGPEKSKLQFSGNHGLLFADDPRGLAKTSASTQENQLNFVSDFAVDGGDVGMKIYAYKPGVTFTNLDFNNQTGAGIKVGNDTWGKRVGMEFDQNRFINIKFNKTGDYGFYGATSMVDKFFLFRCAFKGQKKAGVAFNFTHMFAGTIQQCRFENINGPGVDLYPWDVSRGYTPHQSAIESSTFLNCGNATQPVIDWNWMEGAALANLDISITDGRKWKYGIRGTGQIFHNIKFRAPAGDMVSGGAALAVRNTRQVKNARPAGNILKDIDANGPLLFINDVTERDAFFETVKTVNPCPPPPLGGAPDCGLPIKLLASSNGYNHLGTIKWWKDEEPTKIYPWAFPALVYNGKFSNYTIDYELFRLDSKGNVLQRIALNGATIGISRNMKSPLSLKKREMLYKANGRKLPI